jgi:hypothetical protein
MPPVPVAGLSGKECSTIFMLLTETVCVLAGAVKVPALVVVLGNTHDTWKPYFGSVRGDKFMPDILRL